MDRPAVVPGVAPARKGSNAVLLALIGFVAVPLVGGLLILLLYLNSQGSSRAPRGRGQSLWISSPPPPTPV
jgi:hypothetical protein